MSTTFVTTFIFPDISNSLHDFSLLQKSYQVKYVLLHFKYQLCFFKAGFKVVKILLNQEAVESLADSLDSRNDEKILSAALYALYHIFHSLQAVGKEETIQKVRCQLSSFIL